MSEEDLRLLKKGMRKGQANTKKWKKPVKRKSTFSTTDLDRRNGRKTKV